MPPLRDQLLTWSETVTDLTVSAEDRFRDGQELLAQGRARGAIYLLGLAAEMWLKVVSFRLLGAKASDAVGPFAKRMRIFMDANASATDRESGHSLRYWAEFIILFSQSHALPLSRE